MRCVLGDFSLFELMKIHGSFFFMQAREMNCCWNARIRPRVTVKNYVHFVCWKSLRVRVVRPTRWEKRCVWYVWRPRCEHENLRTFILYHKEYFLMKSERQKCFVDFICLTYYSSLSLWCVDASVYILIVYHLYVHPRKTRTYCSLIKYKLNHFDAIANSFPSFTASQFLTWLALIAFETHYTNLFILDEETTLGMLRVEIKKKSTSTLVI